MSRWAIADWAIRTWGLRLRQFPAALTGSAPRRPTLGGQDVGGPTRAPARQPRCEADPPRVHGHPGGDTRGDTRVPRRGREPHHLPRERHDPVAGPRRHGLAQHPDRARRRPLTNRTSFTSPSWFVLLRRTVTRMPSPSAAVGDVVPRSALASLRRIPAMKSQPRSAATASDSRPRPPGAWPVAKHGREVRGAKGRRLAAAALGGGPRAGRGRLAGEPRGSRPRRPPASAALADARPVSLELGEVEGEGCVVERPASQASSRWSAPAWARRVFGSVSEWFPSRCTTAA